jgi:putative tryptophan/tyrosine transport system substrate-binding protein
MNRRIIGIALYALLFALCFDSEAQQPKKVARIGYLSTGTPTSEATRSEPIRLALRELGYTEGENIAVEYRYAEGKVDRAPELAAELVRLKVDIIVVAGGGNWIRAVKNATKTIPIVMVGAGADPVERGLVESLARPGGNVTGITLLTRELGSKRLELFKEAVPKLASVALLYDPALTAARELKEDLPATARALKLTIQPWEVRDADGFERVFDALSKKRPDGLYAYPSGPLMFANVKRIAEFALKSLLPSIFYGREAIEAGGDRILKGAKPADLPVERPTKFEFIINLKTAKQIGLTIPPSVLARADKVIK